MLYYIPIIPGRIDHGPELIGALNRDMPKLDCKDTLFFIGGNAIG